MYRPQSPSFFLLIAVLLMPALSEAQTARKHMIVIGVPDEQEDSGAVHSARLMHDTLRVHCGISTADGHTVHLLAPLSSDLAPRAPTKANLLNCLAETLKDVAPQDEIWFYYCGHGVTINKKSYLVPSSTIAGSHALPANVDALVEVSFIHQQLAKTTAALRVMILDCCQSGEVELISPTKTNQLPAEAWASVFQNGKVHVLASCGNQQHSLLWPSRKCGLFTFWLCQGLKGAADSDHNGRLALSELFNYSKARVAESLPLVKAEICRRANVPLKRAPEKLFQQCPQAWMAAEREQHAPVFALGATTFHQAMQVLSELTHDLVMLHSTAWTTSAPPTVAVGEFLEVKGTSVELRGRHGLLGKLAADRLTQNLLQLRGRDYLVMQPQEVARQLLDIGIRARHEPKSWEKSASDYFLDTTFVYERDRKRIQLTSSLFDCASGKSLNTTTTYIHVNRELESVLGNEDAAVAPPANLPTSKLPTKPVAEKSTKPEQVEIKPWFAIAIQRKTSGGQFQPVTDFTRDAQGAFVFKVRPGDELQFEFTNQTQQPLAFVPLIDGTTVLEQRAGLTPEECLRSNLYFFSADRQPKLLRGWMHFLAQSNNQPARPVRVPCLQSR